MIPLKDNLPTRHMPIVTLVFIGINTYALSGTWNMEEEAILLAKEQGEIMIRFSANKVNLVAGSMHGATAEILLDGKRIDPSVAGSDVLSDGTVIFKDHDLYNLVDLRGDYGEHELIIRILGPGIRAFAFTFG